VSSSLGRPPDKEHTHVSITATPASPAVAEGVATGAPSRLVVSGRLVRAEVSP
jgi:hypothetical protein